MYLSMWGKYNDQANKNSFILPDTLCTMNQPPNVLDFYFSFCELGQQESAPELDRDFNIKNVKSVYEP